MEAELKRIPTLIYSQCEEFCLETKLGDEICSCDVINHKGHCKTIS